MNGSSDVSEGCIAEVRDVRRVVAQLRQQVIHALPALDAVGDCGYNVLRVACCELDQRLGSLDQGGVGGGDGWV